MQAVLELERSVASTHLLTATNPVNQAVDDAAEVGIEMIVQVSVHDNAQRSPTLLCTVRPTSA